MAHRYVSWTRRYLGTRSPCVTREPIRQLERGSWGVESSNIERETTLPSPRHHLARFPLGSQPSAGRRSGERRRGGHGFRVELWPGPGDGGPWRPRSL